LKLRDRDAIYTKDGFLFRVYGYLHPKEGYVCDPEYALPQVFVSDNPRAKRGLDKPKYYKFFADEGMKLIYNNYPQYQVFHEPLQKCVPGVYEGDISEVRKPEEGLQRVLKLDPNDALLKALHDLFGRVLDASGLKDSDFGVFGSLLHDFYHPDFSDLDFIVYGKQNLERLCNGLDNLYKEDPSLRNEFDFMSAVESKDWKFINYSLEDYLWHQRRKMIYACFESKDAGRVVKVEFEPVKDWTENVDKFNNFARIYHVGWIKAIVEITDDKEGPFIPSIYQIKIKEILEGPEIENITQIFSYMEEFRFQAKKGEKALVEGNLEKVIDGTNTYYQITLSYGYRYYEQTFKVITEE